MKHKPESFLGWCLLLLFFVASARDGISPDGYPSVVSPNKRGLSAGDAFVVERSDLRLIFCDSVTMAGRIRASQCVVDGSVPGSGKGRLLEIGKGTPLKEVLQQVGLIDWHGGQPQIRLIKRNEIRQSERPDNLDSKQFDLEEFLNQTVVPGDIVVLTRKT